MRAVEYFSKLGRQIEREIVTNPNVSSVLMSDNHKFEWQSARCNSDAFDNIFRDCNHVALQSLLQWYDVTTSR